MATTNSTTRPMMLAYIIVPNIWGHAVATAVFAVPTAKLITSAIFQRHPTKKKINKLKI